MPPNTVKVDRSTKWGNPFVPGRVHPFDARQGEVLDRHHSVRLYRRYAQKNEELIAAARAELAGRNLACWCSRPSGSEEDCCHAAVLLELANP